jgi:hypothetical protein
VFDGSLGVDVPRDYQSVCRLAKGREADGARESTTPLANMRKITCVQFWQFEGKTALMDGDGLVEEERFGCA